MDGEFYPDASMGLFAGIAFALGMSEEEADAVYRKIQFEQLPDSPSKAMARVQEALREVRNER